MNDACAYLELLENIDEQFLLESETESFPIKTKPRKNIRAFALAAVMLLAVIGIGVFVTVKPGIKTDPTGETRSPYHNADPELLSHPVGLRKILDEELVWRAFSSGCHVEDSELGNIAGFQGNFDHSEDLVLKSDEVKEWLDAFLDIKVTPVSPSDREDDVLTQYSREVYISVYQEGFPKPFMSIAESAEGGACIAILGYYVTNENYKDHALWLYFEADELPKS